MKKKNPKILSPDKALVAIDSGTFLTMEAIKAGAIPTVMISMLEEQSGSQLACQLCAIGGIDEDQILRILGGAVKQIEENRKPYKSFEMN